MNRRNLFNLIPALLIMAIAVWSCKKDEAPKPAPQVSGSKNSLNLIPEASETITLTIVAPAKFASITAAADKGTATIANVTGAGTEAGGAQLTYVAPAEIGNYKITVTALDQAGLSGTLEITVAVTAKPPVTVPAGNVSGTWVKNTIYVAGGTLIIPKGQTLTIQEGVTVIFDGDGSQGAPELSVQGSLFSQGTAAKPVTFTIPETKRTKANIFAGLWGGIQATQDATEMVLQYTNVEYVGAPTGGTNPSKNIGPYADGDPRYGVLFSNTNGKFVMQNSRIAYTADDGMRIVGGTILISNNLFVLTGKNGGESVNIKSSVTGTVAYNTSWRGATNAWKWSNASGSSATPQTDIDVYNNTSIECGWRQTKTGRGGSLNVEKGARGKAYNNLVVNCRFGTRVVDDADVANLAIGYNHYYGTDAVMVNEFYPTGTKFVKGNSETGKDIAGAAKDNDPSFVNYIVSTYTSAYPVDPLTLDYMPATVDYRIKAGGPGLTKGKTGFALKPDFTVNGVKYSAPAPSANIGAYGSN
jgi:hypothetical protein